MTAVGFLDTCTYVYGPCLEGTNASDGAGFEKLAGSPVFAFPAEGVALKRGEEVQMLSREATEALMQCTWANGLLLESRRLCENRSFWAYPPPVSPDSPFGCVPGSSDLPGCAEVLRTGRFLPVFVADLGCVEGVEVGLGLFAAEGIAKHSILGEYTGVLRLFDGKDSAYSYALPVVDPDLVIDAKDFGNLCRLINHSEDWNAELVAVHHENMLHVVCRAVQDIAPNQQILIHYGPGYWCAEGRQGHCVDL